MGARHAPRCQRSRHSAPEVRWASRAHRSISVRPSGRRHNVGCPASSGGADHRVLVVAGAAAGVAAIFKAPATGAILPQSKCPIKMTSLGGCFFPRWSSAATGYLAFVAVNGTARLFPIAGEPTFNFRDLPRRLRARASPRASHARAFAAMLRRAKAIASARRPLIAGGRFGSRACGAVRRCAGSRPVKASRSDPGYDTIQWALDPQHGAWLVLLVLVLRCAGDRVDRRGRGSGRSVHPSGCRGGTHGSRRRWRGAESRHESVRRRRCRGVFGGRLPGAA